MVISQKDFAEANEKATDYKFAGTIWEVFPRYKPYEHERNGFAHPIIRAEPIRPGLLWDLQSPLVYYKPLQVPGLFLEFATLFRDIEMDLDLAPALVLDWVNRYGVLGSHTTHVRRSGERISGRLDDQQSVMNFYLLSTEANYCLRLFEAAKNPDGPDVRKLRSLGASGKTPEESKAVALDEVYRTVDKYLKSETYVRSYRHGDGTASRGFGFRSLLGALYLQLSILVNAPQGHVRFCKSCREVIAFELGERPATDAPKGTRGKHSTHSNREYCKEKYGITNYCKNKFNNARQKKAKEGS